jgi:flagellar basal body rod protein FlgB
MNWGHKIIIVYSAFAAGILFMALKFSGEKTDLVTPDYYARELKFQQQIDNSRRAESLSEKIKISKANDSLEIKFPTDFSGKKIEGDVEFYFAADKNKDQHQKFSTSVTEFKMLFQNNGLYEVHINAVVSGQQYYFNEKIFL